MIAIGLVGQTWDYIQHNPGEYAPGAWAVRAGEHAGAVHDFAGTALMLLGADFWWREVPEYPPAPEAPAGWFADDVFFSTLPDELRANLFHQCLDDRLEKNAAAFWHSMGFYDRVSIALAARVALGIDSADALVLFEENATLGEVGRKVNDLMERGRRQWTRAHAPHSRRLVTA